MAVAETLLAACGGVPCQNAKGEARAFLGMLPHCQPPAEEGKVVKRGKIWVRRGCNRAKRLWEGVDQAAMAHTGLCPQCEEPPHSLSLLGPAPDRPEETHCRAGGLQRCRRILIPFHLRSLPVYSHLPSGYSVPVFGVDAPARGLDWILATAIPGSSITLNGSRWAPPSSQNSLFPLLHFPPSFFLSTLKHSLL